MELRVELVPSSNSSDRTSSENLVELKVELVPLLSELFFLKTSSSEAWSCYHLISASEVVEKSTLAAVNDNVPITA